MWGDPHTLIRTNHDRWSCYLQATRSGVEASEPTQAATYSAAGRKQALPATVMQEAVQLQTMLHEADVF